MNSTRFSPVFLLLIAAFLCQSCQSENKENNPYSFFVAGHAYGSPNEKNVGMYPSFVEKFDWLTQQENLRFGVLTGDVVRTANEKSWTTTWEELKRLNLKIHIAAGNHDLKDKALFKKYVQQSYYSFSQNGDLFLILNPNLDHWNISGEQLTFLQNELVKAEQYRHIFIFAHQLIWWQESGQWAACPPNSFEDKADTLTFQSTVLPLLEQLDNQVMIFAGDVGAVPHSPAICYLKKGNLSMIASGMGVDEKDNFLLIEVNDNDKINVELVSLRGKDLGHLEDYLKEI